MWVFFFTEKPPSLVLPTLTRLLHRGPVATDERAVTNDVVSQAVTNEAVQNQAVTNAADQAVTNEAADQAVTNEAVDKEEVTNATITSNRRADGANPPVPRDIKGLSIFHVNGCFTH